MKYEKPPLIEVVIEIRFNSSVEYKLLERFAKKVSDKFIHQHDQFDIDIAFLIEPDGTDKVKSNRIKGLRLETANVDHIMIIAPYKFTISALNPYPGWDEFFKTFSNYWQQFKKITDCRHISRAACLSMNRIDVPLFEDILNIDDYLNIGIKAPKDIILDGYQAVMGISLDDQIKASVTTASHPPVIMNHASLALNIDVFQDKDIPQTNEGLFGILEKIHVHKNRLFKDFVTLKSEALFVKVNDETCH